MAEVRLGLDVACGHAVAVKHLTAGVACDEAARRRFCAETRLTAGLDHPSVVRVLDSGQDLGLEDGASSPYLVLEFIPGRSLSALLRQGPVALTTALQLTRQLLEAVQYCHDRGLVHGDIKPANVMVTPSGGVKLMDFGLARMVGVEGTGAAEAESCSGFATIRYASPEQLQRLPVGTRSDLYAVGCVLYELLTGRTPFTGELDELIAAQQTGQPAAPSEVVADVTADVDALVLRALARDPADRYPSATAMIADLDRALHGHRPVPRPVAVVDPGAEIRRVMIATGRARQARQRRAQRMVLRSVSGLAAGVLPVAAFGLLHLRGTGQPGDGAAAMALGGVVRGTDALVSSGPAPIALPQSPAQPVPASLTGAALLLPRSAAVVFSVTRDTTAIRSGQASWTSGDGVQQLAPSADPATAAVPSSAPPRTVASPTPTTSGRPGPVPTTSSAPVKPKPPAPATSTPTGSAKPQPKPPAPPAPKPPAPKPPAPKPPAPKPPAPKPVKQPKVAKPKPVQPKPVKPKPVKPPKVTKPQPVKPKPVKPPKVTKPQPVKPKPVKPPKVTKPKPATPPKAAEPKPGKPAEPAPETSKADKPKPSKPAKESSTA